MRVINGDLTYVAEPLMLGHYRSSRLTGTEAVMDGLLNGEMTETLAARLYPEAIGSHRVFINRHPNFERSALPRPKAVIIAGLGEEGRLKGADLVEAVKKASLAWAQACDTDTDTPAVEDGGDTRRTRRARYPTAAATGRFELAATLIGSGGTEIGPGEAARLIVQGVCEANATMRNARLRWPRSKRAREPSSISAASPPIPAPPIVPTWWRRKRGSTG